MNTPDFLTQVNRMISTAVARAVPTFRWGMVTATAPLTVILDHEDAPLSVSPQSLTTGLRVGTRVFCLVASGRVTVIARRGGEIDTRNAPTLSGDYTSLGAWKALDPGWYKVWGGLTTWSTPSGYGFVQVLQFNNDGTAFFHQQSSGKIFKMGWNASTTSVVWREMFSVENVNLQGSGIDLNNYVSTGAYFFDQNITASGGQNFPREAAGLLEVYNRPTADSQHVYQRYTTYKDRGPSVYVRARYLGAWSAWTRVGGTLAGVVTFPANANVAQSIAVSFPGGFFNATPAITTGVHSTTPQQCSDGFTAPSASGATITFYRTTSASTSVHWTATEMQ